MKINKLALWALVFTIVLPNAIFLSEVKNASAQTLVQKIKKVQKDSQYHMQSIKRIDLSKVKEREILVQLKESASLSSGVFGCKQVEVTGLLHKKNYTIFRVPQSLNYDRMLAKFRNSPAVLDASPNYLLKVKSAPNDGEYKNGNQWYLNAINMPKAWDVAPGSSKVVVAVIDTGVDMNNPDLQGNSFILNQSGQDIANNDNTPVDTFGHGTHVSGIIAAATDNGEGIASVAGLNSNIKILPVKVANGDTFSIDKAISGIYYAVDYAVNHNIHEVINMSFGSTYNDPNLQKALWYAHNHGVVLVAAAGNQGTSQPSYPASYYPVISVAATDQNGHYADASSDNFTSNYGDSIDVSAPGVNILSTNNDSTKNPYSEESGTSFSAPIVSAVAALLMSKHPDWSPGQIEWAIEHSASSSSGWDPHYGYGKVDAFNTLSSSSSSLPSLSSNNQNNPSKLSIGNNQSRNVTLPFDQNWYDFNLPTDAEVAIRVTNVPNNIDPSICDPCVQSSQSNLTVLNAAGRGKNDSFVFQASKGSYKFGVIDNYNHWSSNPYSIKIDTIPRIHGTDRYQTAAAISSQGWTSANTVVLARGDNFADALAGTPLAYKENAPILLTETKTLPASTKQEIQRLGAKNVIILGGPNAVSPKVENQIKSMVPNVKRIYGSDRFQTANQIYMNLKSLGDNNKTAMVVYGKKFPDALSISSYAARKGIPIFLVESNKIPTETKAILKNFNKTYVIGGPGVVGSSVMGSLGNLNTNPVRIYGSNRYQTGAAAFKYFSQPSSEVYVALGSGFPDALTGSELAAKKGAGVILVEHDKIPSSTQTLINQKRFGNYAIFGGTGAISENIAKQLIK